MLCFRASGLCMFLNDVKIDPRDTMSLMVPHRLVSARHKGLDHDCAGMLAAL